MIPKRVQRKRTKGYRTPENTLYVGRPTKWGNPFPICKEHGAQCSVDRYVRWLKGEYEPKEVGNIIIPSITDIKMDLKGKNLSCFCPEGQPCHADVLLKLANS